MDWMTAVILLGLVCTGAVFIGFPAGYVYAKRRVWKKIEKGFVIIEADENGFNTTSATKKRCENPDVLDAEFIEEKSDVRNFRR